MSDLKSLCERLVALLLCQAAVAYANLSVINGRHANIGQFKFFAQVVYTTTTGGTAECGGSILTPYDVLTSAHCIEGFSEGSVFAGIVNKRAEPQPDMQVQNFDRILVHPRFISGDLHSAYDIALVKLMTPFTETSAVGFTDIPQHDDGYLEARTEVITLGYGEVAPDRASNKLRYARVNVVWRQRCRREYSWLSLNHFCAGAANYGSGSGDSGSPLIIYSENRDRYIQLGIVHGGEEGKEFQQDKFPSTYVRTSVFCSFIQRNTVFDCSQSQ